MRRCPDQGFCHHECGDGPCWRVRNASPFMAYGPEWPPEVRAEHAALVPRQPDRRQSPRREAERTLHYAREHLLATALAVAEANGPGGLSDYSLLRRLDEAAADYREAERSANAP